MTLPIVQVSGSSFEQGLVHGRELRDRIARNVEVYFDRFERDVHLSREQVLQMASRYGAVVAEQTPDYWEGMRGIAEGSGFSLGELSMLNMRYEILYCQWTQQLIEKSTDGCTSFAVQPSLSVDGHLVVGQNWDWLPGIEGALVRTSNPGGVETLAFTEAGIFGGKIGLNSEGLGLAVNGLMTVADDWSRLRKPFHVRCWEILRSRTFDEAVAVVRGEERSCSTNFLIAQVPDQVVDLEAAPGAVNGLACDAGCLTHANHFVDPAGLGVTEPPSARRYLSRNRHARLRERLLERIPVSIPRLQEVLRDHEEYPNALCRHPDETLPEEERSITVASVIIDLNARRMWCTERQPCLTDYQEASLT